MYFIKKIDRAFQVWKSAPWYKEVSFEMFCRYILPYRVSDEQLVEHWRDSLIQSYVGYIRGVTEVDFRLFPVFISEIMKY